MSAVSYNLWFSYQDIMKKVLDKHRSGIIVKQVAAGKEFQGCPFYSKPDVIHFKVIITHYMCVILYSIFIFKKKTLMNGWLNLFKQSIDCSPWLKSWHPMPFSLWFAYFSFIQCLYKSQGYFFWKCLGILTVIASSNCPLLTLLKWCNRGCHSSS